MSFPVQSGGAMTHSEEENREKTSPVKIDKQMKREKIFSKPCLHFLVNQYFYC